MIVLDISNVYHMGSISFDGQFLKQAMNAIDLSGA